MRVLLYRALDTKQIEDLYARHPSAKFVQTTHLEVTESELPECEIAFGPVPVGAAERSPKLRWVQLISAGLDGYERLFRPGLTVTTGHGLHAAALAEHVLLGILAGARRLPFFQHRQRERSWERQVGRPTLLSGQTVGLIGYGVVGREVASRLKPFGVSIRAVKREATPCPPDLDALGTLDALDDLLRTSDHVVVSLPLTPATRGLLDARRIGLLPNGACFHNVARGGLVDESALRARLNDGTLAGATLDVFETEPLAADSPWWTTPNALITPHLAGHHGGLPAATFARFCENLDRYVRGEALHHVANFARGY